MSSVQFLGVYTARGEYRPPSLPMENKSGPWQAEKTANGFFNESGLWQAWKAANGSFVVQPLARNREPWGGHFLLSAADFEENFSSLPSDEDIASAGKGLFRSDAPDLIEFWFEQAQRSAAGKGGFLPGSVQTRKRAPLVSSDPPEQEPPSSPLDEPDLPDETSPALSDESGLFEQAQHSIADRDGPIPGSVRTRKRSPLVSFRSLEQEPQLCPLDEPGLLEESPPALRDESLPEQRPGTGGRPG